MWQQGHAAGDIDGHDLAELAVTCKDHFRVIQQWLMLVTLAIARPLVEIYASPLSVTANAARRY
jgi:hypothetical protein